jgi:hypothetical protein
MTSFFVISLRLIVRCGFAFGMPSPRFFVLLQYKRTYHGEGKVIVLCSGEQLQSRTMIFGNIQRNCAGVEKQKHTPSRSTLFYERIF